VSLDLVVGSLSLGVLIVMLCALQDVFMWAVVLFILARALLFAIMWRLFCRLGL
jgi:hypothetical protein